MKKRIRTAIIILSVILVLCLSVILGGFIRIKVMESRLHPVTQPFSEMKRVPMMVNYIFGTHETEKCIGFSDNTFIGTVEEVLGTEYDELFYHRFRLYEETPQTVYRVKVHRNIKGDLPEELTMYFYGGQQPGGLLEEYRRLPEDKTTNVFFCCEVDGKIIANSADYLGSYDWYENGANVPDMIEKYEKDFKNQDLSVRHD